MFAFGLLLGACAVISRRSPIFSRQLIWLSIRSRRNDGILLKNRCLPVEVDCAPEVRLAIRLWNDVTRPLTLIDACMGRLLDMLPSGASPVDITKSLLALWEGARREKLAPFYLLGTADFETADKEENRRIVHGVRPSIADLRNGCFMERRPRITAALSIIRERWSQTALGATLVFANLLDIRPIRLWKERASSPSSGKNSTSKWRSRGG